MSQNKTNENTDGRVINQVIYEKALLGRVPLYFQVAGDDRFHPCAWQTHPHLTAVVFSDGTTSHVTALKPTEAVAEKVGPIPDTYFSSTRDAVDYDGPESVKAYYDDADGKPGPATETASESDVRVSTEAIAKLFSPGE